jgi:glycosyltransferase involved in cell wall biosynthesis
VLRYLYPPPALTEPFWRAMQAGFGNASAKRLEELKPGLQADEMAHAAWALSYWDRVNGDYERALDHLLMRRLVYPWARRETPHIVVEIEVLLKLGRVDAASRIIEDAIKDVGESTELCFCAANVLGSRLEQTQADQLRLGWLNKPLEAAGLGPIQLKDLSKSLSIDNIWAPSVGPHRRCCDAKISVLMPAYNAEETIGTAIDSVLAQTWTGLELLIVDDGSRDRTWSIIQSSAMRDPRVVPIRHSRNRGAYAARNTALGQASGDFVTVHDSDDWSHPQKMALQVLSLLENGGVAIATNKIRVDRHLNIANRPHGSILNECYASLMMRRAEVIDLGGWDESRMGADAELWNRLLRKHDAKKTILKPKIPLAFYLTRPESLTNQALIGLATHHFGARRQYTEAYKYWHEIERMKPQPDWSMREMRRFPVPSICKPGPIVTSEYDILVVSDFSQAGDVAASTALLMRRIQAAGLSCAGFHWPCLERAVFDVDLEIRKLLHEGIAGNVVSGEGVDCNLTIFSDQGILDHLPDRLPNVRTRNALIVVQPSARDHEVHMTNAEIAFGVRPKFASATQLDEVLSSLLSELAA